MSFMSRPLTMSRIGNALIYGFLISLTNACLEAAFHISSGTMLLVAIGITWLSVMENSWVSEIERKTG